MSKYSSEYELNIENIDLKKFIDSINDEISSLCITKNINFSYIEKDLPERLMLDTENFNRAIINLVANGVEYAGDGGSLMLSAVRRDEFIEFTVEDSGVGFNEKDIDNVTDQFFMGNSSRNAKMHYGMGLYIVKTIVEKHGGALSISKSDTLGGGLVRIKIPIK